MDSYICHTAEIPLKLQWLLLLLLQFGCNFYGRPNRPCAQAREGRWPSDPVVLDEGEGVHASAQKASSLQGEHAAVQYSTPVPMGRILNCCVA